MKRKHLEEQCRRDRLRRKKGREGRREGKVEVHSKGIVEVEGKEVEGRGGIAC